MQSRPSMPGDVSGVWALAEGEKKNEQEATETTERRTNLPTPTFGVTGDDPAIQLTNASVSSVTSV